MFSGGSGTSTKVLPSMTVIVSSADLSPNKAKGDGSKTKTRRVDETKCGCLWPIQKRRLWTWLTLACPIEYGLSTVRTHYSLLPQTPKVHFLLTICVQSSIKCMGVLGSNRDLPVWICEFPWGFGMGKCWAVLIFHLAWSVSLLFGGRRLLSTASRLHIQYCIEEASRNWWFALLMTCGQSCWMVL